VYEQRRAMTSEDWLAMTAESDHPIGWWLEQPTSHADFRSAQRAMEIAIATSRTMLEQSTLSTAERLDITNLLRMLAAQEGPLKSKDRIRYFFYHYLPWIGFLKEFLFKNPYGIFIASWLAIATISIVMAFMHGAYPIVATVAIPLMLAAGLVAGIMRKDGVFAEKHERPTRLHPTVRFSAMFPITILLWASFLTTSVFGQLPIGMSQDSWLVVSRDSTVQRTIGVNSSVVRYPNLWETVVRGDSLMPIPEQKKALTPEFAVPSLTNGKLGMVIISSLKPEMGNLIGTNYNALPAERDRLIQEARGVAEVWCNNYQEGVAQGSLIESLNALESEHYLIQASDATLTWTKEEVVAVEKIVEKTTTTQDKVVINEKQQKPQTLNVP
jgi:hypothetical protein